MCDTFAVLPGCSAFGSMILGKNSDRPAFDCQPLAFHKGEKHPKGAKLKLAYVEIPEAEETYTSVGSSPYWCWGYEEGVNEYGVAIGNEAVYTKDLTENTELETTGKPVEKGILGMELLRLGLERGKTAREAVQVMTGLIETYGQWGSGVPMSDTISGSYNNSFMIADGNEAFILETAGKRWALRQIKEGSAAISNELTIRTDVTEHSRDLVDYAIERGWHKKGEPFDFALSYINQKNPRQLSHIRVQRSRQLLRNAVNDHGTVGMKDCRRILRDHYEDTFLEGPYFNPSSPDFLTICMHNSVAGFTWGNTASSVITILPKEEASIPVMWWAPVVPCCSLYVPIYVDAGEIPEVLSLAGTYGKTLCAPSEVNAEDTYKAGSFWWEMRSLLDLINGDENGSAYHRRHGRVRALFDELEEGWFAESAAVEKKAADYKKAGDKAKMAEVLRTFTEKCVKEGLEAIVKAKKEIENL